MDEAEASFDAYTDGFTVDDDRSSIAQNEDQVRTHVSTA